MGSDRNTKDFELNFSAVVQNLVVYAIEGRPYFIRTLRAQCLDIEQPHN